MLYGGATAQESWNILKAIFQDNKQHSCSRVVYLENEFSALPMSNFTYISSYYQKLKALKDQLVNVDQNISEQKLVLRMLDGLVNTDYDMVASLVVQIDPLSTFETASFPTP